MSSAVVELIVSCPLRREALRLGLQFHGCVGLPPATECGSLSLERPSSATMDTHDTRSVDLEQTIAKKEIHYLGPNIGRFLLDFLVCFTVKGPL